jgi:TonB-dependent starch-binding outer membrane protein SusC
LFWSVGGNISGLQNRVVSLAEGEPILGGFGLSDGPLTRTEPGQPIGSFYLWKMEGIFQTQEEIDAHAFSKQRHPTRRCQIRRPERR